METATGLIRTRRTLGADGESVISHSARCPNDGEAKPLGHCADCARLRGAVREGHLFMLRCEGPAKRAVDARRVPLNDSARALTVWDVMGNEVTCVSADASVEMVASLLSEGALRSVAVVDHANKLCGIVSRTDLLRVGFEDAGVSEVEERELPQGYHATVVATRLIREVMTPIVHALPEDAPVAYAVALMARADLHEVPVVSHDGVVVGMVTALDVMKWVASGLGYDEPAEAR